MLNEIRSVRRDRRCVCKSLTSVVRSFSHRVSTVKINYKSCEYYVLPAIKIIFCINIVSRSTFFTSL